ncbi:MAG: sialate O-acetylesterase [Bacteroidales bacterium]|nr:sialate O-acetylesterase [Bacteroidales bacterium]
MKIQKYLLLQCAAVVSAFAATAATPASVYITAGQSNADGRETIEFLPSYLNNGYKHLRYANVTSECDGTFSDFKFGKRFAFCDITNYYIDQASDQDFYAIKCAYGGTSITPGATHAHLPIWYANPEWIAANKAYRGNIDEGKSLTLALTQGFAECANTTLSKLPGGYDVKAIMWHQGESDRHKSSDYYQNFKDMITYMRGQIYAVTGDEADKTLPFIFGTVPHDSKQYSAEVEAAQMRVASELPNVYAIDLSDAGLRGDALHFDGPWTEYVGKAMYNKLVELNLVNGKAIAAEKPKKASITDGISVDAERQWHFGGQWTEETEALLSADEQWEEFKSLGYRLLTPLRELQELTHQGKTVKETEGLYFKCPTGNRMILNPNKFVCLYNDNISMVIPKVAAGQTVAITTRSAKGERGLTTDSMQYLELVSGGVPSSGKVTNVWKVKDEVKDPVDLIFHPEGGGIYVYDIEITLANL